MAKKRKSGGPTFSDPIKPVSKVLRAVNKQTSGAGVAVAEAISTPGYSEQPSRADGDRTGCLILDAFIWSKYDELGGGVATNEPIWEAQIQTGDQTGTPAMLDPDSPYLLGDIRLDTPLATSGAAQYTFPMHMTFFQQPPLVVMPEITFAHWTHNHAQYNSKDLWVVMFYQIVEIAASLFTVLLQNQWRTS